MRLCALLLVWFELASGAVLRLRNRTIDTGQTAGYAIAETAGPVANSYAAMHFLVQLDHTPCDADFKSLADRGAIVTGYVPDNGLVVWAPGPDVLQSAGTIWIGKIEAADKISPLLTADEAWPHEILVEFHADVALDDARALLTGLNLAISQRDAGPHRLIIMADFGQLQDLAAQDATAYLFPAPGADTADSDLNPCASALTVSGAIGQYVASVGDGWGGPNHQAVTLGYFFSNAAPTLSAAAVQSEVLRAFSGWSSVVQVNFAPAGLATAERTVNVLFAAGDHGDGYPFDGRGGVLAHTFYPTPTNPEPLAGDMHFDATENWQVGSNTDLFSVALHEAGHALGLGHSDNPADVMYPYYRQVSALAPGDIAAIRKLYPANDGTASSPAPTPTPTPTPAPTPQPAALALTIQPAPASTAADSITLNGTASGGSGSLNITWSTDRGFAGSATGAANWSAVIALATGANQITMTLRDGQSQTVTQQVTVTRQAAPQTPASLTVVSPLPAALVRTASSSISVTGTAAHASGIKAVSWSNDKGSSGVARGTTDWDTGPIALATGLNQITVVAQPVNGAAATQVIAVNYTPAQTNDTQPPSITVVAPASATSSTTASTITVRGTASDGGGVALVTWSTLAGDRGTATGTTSWSTSPIPLIVGYNTIQITAADTSGNTATRTISVTRR